MEKFPSRTAVFHEEEIRVKITGVRHSGPDRGWGNKDHMIKSFAASDSLDRAGGMPRVVGDSRPT